MGCLGAEARVLANLAEEGRGGPCRLGCSRLGGASEDWDSICRLCFPSAPGGGRPKAKWAQHGQMCSFFPPREDRDAYFHVKSFDF